MDNNQYLTDEERKELEYQLIHGVCNCGHERCNHNRFIDGLFVGCQLCKCDKFHHKENINKDKKTIFRMS